MLAFSKVKTAGHYECNESFSDLNIGLKVHMTRIHLDKLVIEKKNAKYGIPDTREFIKALELYVIWRKLKVSGKRLYINCTHLLIIK